MHICSESDQFLRPIHTRFFSYCCPLSFPLIAPAGVLISQAATGEDLDRSPLQRTLLGAHRTLKHNPGARTTFF